MAIIQGGRVIEGVVPEGGVTSGEGLGGDISVMRAGYDFAVDGGAVGTITLANFTIPAGAIILGGLLDVTTLVTSGGAATVSIGIEGAADVVAATAVSGAPYSTTGRKSVIPAWTGATTIKTTVARSVTATIATATLTAGAFDVYLFYLMTQ
jgi:hypothetical protein